MAEQTKVGELLTGDEPRDAIHVAIAPVVADERLVPGTHVGFTRDGDTEHVGVRSKQMIGVVDPFLTGFVNIGERIWLFLYPQTITSLRHNWTHPAFADVKVVSPTKTASERWLRDWCESHESPPYEHIIGAVLSPDGRFYADAEQYYGVKIEGDYLTSVGSSMYGTIPSEFWDHVEIVTGKKTTRPSQLACSC